MFELFEFIYVVFPLGWKIKKLRNLFIDAEFQVLSAQRVIRTSLCLSFNYQIIRC